MANRLYFVCSFFFVAASIMAFIAVESAINGLYMIGSVLFFIAATFGVFETPAGGRKESHAEAQRR